CARRHETYDYW
nr:immunoglobulin heavy chain junction region [Macaca mulatta]MOV87976.1 immunoglobulin heavy chain junction region [Macaca mulatta]MOV88180.1 immunoglobulin heavy chain junction region [Macaca mulatta]MOV88422.1 immunoglobulin heavy chain junction region [Macaca mulatta]MOV88432.1 immunoglobulin heavy chain junction region [Macaca mulatta]